MLIYQSIWEYMYNHQNIQYTQYSLWLLWRACTMSHSIACFIFGFSLAPSVHVTSDSLSWAKLEQIRHSPTLFIMHKLFLYYSLLHYYTYHNSCNIFLYSPIIPLCTFLFAHYHSLCHRIICTYDHLFCSITISSPHQLRPWLDPGLEVQECSLSWPQSMLLLQQRGR